MHCGPDIGIARLSVMITPEPQAINQLKHPIVRDLAVYTQPSGVYTSQIPHWGVLTNTYSTLRKAGADPGFSDGGSREKFMVTTPISPFDFACVSCVRV